MKKLDDLSAAWLEHMQAEKTPTNTIKARLRVLRSVGNPGTATREEIEAWWRTRSDLAPSTRANDLACLRAFYRWCAVWEHREDNPTVRLNAPRVPNGLPRPVNRTELDKLLETLTAPMRRAVCLGAYAGLRVSESASLSWDDVDVDLRRIRVRGKGQKGRVVAIGTVLLAELGTPKLGANVVTRGKPYSVGTLTRMLNRAMAAAGVRATSHQLRHRYGTAAYRQSRDLLAVAKLMGHASTTTTQVYAMAADDVAQSIAEGVAEELTHALTTTSKYYRDQASAVERRLGTLSAEECSVGLVEVLERERQLWLQLADEIDDYLASAADDVAGAGLF